ncbi:Ig-like domain-containing protein [Flavobacterium sp. LC2016-01]|uniref:Ig-like domain-containing protein n=1 Tax=Flavobacterium sp. LC2016-01 TaxID=2675876 RepID=UPI0012BADA90|nr:Ig-like domain-containing protein [Flavobacterium sp. LC2016-01]MTH16434.1 carbohydrate-binding protein [Flavobacterium sp. LC2016-01]
MHKTTQKPTNRVIALIMPVIIMLLLITKTNAQSVTPWMTTGDQTKLIQQQTAVNFGTNSGTNPSTVTVNAGTTYQTMDGFGYTLTEGSCEVISGMAATQQNQLLNDLYNPTTGLNANVIRISIGASDLSSSSYSYNETSGDTNMNNFSLNGPDLTYLIPIIKKIQLINPNIKILATPWSPPRWMKTNNSWVGGNLQTQYYAAYAKYFVKYFDAMAAQGISIWGITPQNEPENPNNEPSMLMNSTEQKNFINQQLGPQMAAAGYGNIKIIAFDHNCDNTAYPIDVLNNSSYVDGAAFHLYLGNISAMSTVKTQTNKNVYFTEQYTGSGGNFSGDFGWHMQNVVIGSTTNWAKTVLEWNAANNSSLGPHTPGGCNSCLGAVTVTSSTTYTKNVAYYIIGQISKFVKPGALRIASSSTSGSILSVGFKNPDGSIALLVYNSGSSSNTIKVVSGSSAFDYAVPAGSAVTFNWSAGAPVAVTGVSVSPTTASVGVNSTQQLTATVAPSNATNQNVTWSSSNTAVATVNSSGLVTGVSAGTATITVTTQDGNKTATSAITVTIVAVTGVTVSPASASIFAGQTQQLTATVSPSNASNTNVTWSSSNTAVATVNSSGLVTGVAQGTATITATTVSGSKTATSSFTIQGQQPYGGTPASIPGIIQAENYDLGGQNVAYNDNETANQGGAYRTSEGVDVTGISGTSGYTVGWTANGEWLEYTANVTAGTYTIDATVSTINSGKQLRILLDGTVLTTVSVPNTGSWDTFQTVSIPNITFAGGNNKVLRFEIIGGDFNIDKIEVKSVAVVPVTSVAVSPTSASILVGNTTQLTATVSPTNATNKNVTWSSSNTSVATVNSSGLVSGVAAGSATITVTTADGAKTATSAITVTASSTGFPGYYNIISRNSNKGLDVADNSTSSGGRIQQYDITSGGGSNQRWKFVSDGSGNYYIIVKSTGMYLAVENNGTGDGLKVQQRTLAASNEFKWTVTDLGTGYYKIINLNSGKSLDVENVSTSNGANIQVWAYTGGLNQQWQFVQVESTAKKALVQTIPAEEENQNDMVIFVSSSNDYLKIDTNHKGNATVEIFSVEGISVLKKNMNFEGSQAEIEISRLPKGIYVVRVNDSTGTYTKKVLKQ